jgi:hypothetical protein
LATSRQEREAILAGYALLDLVPFAIRLTGELRAEAPLALETKRVVAERLAAAPDGAGLAAELWPALLADEPVDPDGWTLFAVALRLCGDEAGAQLADGFGAALVGSAHDAPAAKLKPLARTGEGAFALAEPPSDGIEVVPENMPRLHATLAQVLAGIGAPDHRVVLDPTGGPEAWLASGQTVVIGAGALGCYGPVEVGWLCTLAVALGPLGTGLRLPGEGPSLEDAALCAFEANPASLAACRVLARLDDRVRGTEITPERVPALVRSSDLARALMLRALQSMRG